MRVRPSAAQAVVLFSIAAALLPAWCDTLADSESAPGTQSIATLEAMVRGNPTAANHRALADACEKAGLLQQASEHYMQAAEIYLELGDAGAYRVLQRKASSLASEALLFIEDPSAKLPLGIYTGAKYEPRYGCYLGAFIADDRSLDSGILLDWRRCADKTKFVELVGKPHASYFNYFLVGKPFPTEWVAHLASIGAAPQMAWEGANSKLGPLSDDVTIRDFARCARAAQIPIFLRFAYEMNGDWTDYGSPQEYIRNFRLVHDVMEREAPNVAMVWAPNCFPTQSMDDYYPGDRYVDWVGVSMYTVYCHNGNPDKPADKEDPTDNLTYIYNQYSPRKPIMIAEHAATHFCQATNKDVTDFAVDKTRYLYGALPRLFPRVKMISWYSRDNIDLPTAPSRKLNNYCLTDCPKLLEAYRQSIAGAYYLSKVPFHRWERAHTPPVIQQIEDERTVSGTIKLSAWVKCPASRPLVKWFFKGEEIGRGHKAPYEIQFDTTSVQNARHAVKIVAYDGEGKVLVRRQNVVVVKN